MGIKTHMGHAGGGEIYGVMMTNSTCSQFADRQAGLLHSLNVYGRAMLAGMVALSLDAGSLAQQRSDNTDADDAFGFSTALTGSMLVVGARGEASAATGMNGDQTNNSAISAGAVYFFQ